MTEPINPPIVDPPAPEPVIPPVADPPAPPEPIKAGDPPRRDPAKPFDPELFDKLFEYYPNEIRERLGVTALEVALARQNAVTEYGLTAEEASAIPGRTAAEITAGAKVTSGIIAKRLESAKAELKEHKPEPEPFYRLPSETDAAKETDPVKRAMAEYARSMGQ